MIAHACRLFPQIPAEAFDTSQDKCFCDTCVDIRGESGKTYPRGQPPSDYVLPETFVRLGLKRDPVKEKMNNTANWHISYHGTQKLAIESILR